MKTLGSSPPRCLTKAIETVCWSLIPGYGFDMNKCNLCGFPVIRIFKGPFGARCIGCKSTHIHRAVGQVLEKLNIPDTSHVYELSSRGALFKYLKKRFKNLMYSEYFDDIQPGDFKKGIQCQDVQNLTYEDESFDLVTSTEVFEHVPNDEKGFQEIYRVLKKDGYFVFTVPLLDSEKTIERARIEDGKIRHYLSPEFHSDRFRGKNKVLAFRNYGLNIQQKLESIGFSAKILTLPDPCHIIENVKVIVCKT